VHREIEVGVSFSRTRSAMGTIPDVMKDSPADASLHDRPGRHGELESV
jgi:hypothetical protein